MRKQCTVDQCENTVKGRGFCDKHLQRLRRYGSTESRRLTFEQRFWSKVDTSAGSDACWLWTGAVNEHGYGVIRPAGRRSGPAERAHRVAVRLDGRDPTGYCVLHSCDNPPCVNPAHLSLGSKADNTQDMIAKQRGLVGVRNGIAKLTDSEVREIRRQRADGVMRKTIAAAFQVSPATITRIVQGKGWRHVV